MRGGLERWKRGAGSQGVRQALRYAFHGSCDSHLRACSGVSALAAYSETGAGTVIRFTVEGGMITEDELTRVQVRLWVDGCDPFTGVRRGRELMSPTADLVLDGTINAPKSFSIAALLHPELGVEFEALQDRLRDRIITTWQRELNARRGAGGSIREGIHRVEVIELQHRRSRALDPHIHRHLWLNVKVQGEDGRWSNVDSRVAMRLHTVINAEGDLAARTDPAWIAALAKFGYTLNDDGEITQLAHAVRPLSRRSAQIETNRTRLLTEWRSAHLGQRPGPDVVAQIDRHAWAIGRPNKPRHLDEGEWSALVRDELVGIDPALLAITPLCGSTAVPIGAVDRDLLAARAVVDADDRSASSSGRFSAFDVRAGAMRAVAASGVVADRGVLQELIDDVVHRVMALTVDLLDEASPAHVKHLMSVQTAALKLDLAARLDALHHPGTPIPTAIIQAIATEELPEGRTLDEDQAAAAAAIAGTDRLVSVTGPAGSGKTTMLRVARAALASQPRQMIVVAPTKKAASVAGREIGTTASSLHALLADHGYRWGRDDAGGQTWARLRSGEVDPATGNTYTGPRQFLFRPRDRIVVDEAGMVDLHTANALAELAADTGVGIAMVGDHLQAAPVGHSGAMACLTRRATAVVELTCIHRFRDPDYAALTLRLRHPRDPDDARTVAVDLDAGGHLHRVVEQDAARDAMVDGYFHWTGRGKRVALVTGTNEEADAINEAIQHRRLELRQLNDRRIAVGQGEQRILEGDIVQTRRNDRTSGVENRALWTVHHIEDTHIELTSISDPADTRTVTREYMAEHVHLAYASTVHGIQGETTDASLVGPGVDAAGLYVGLTRGRHHNKAIVIAPNRPAAVDALAATMLRGIPEVALDESRVAARRELGRAARAPESAPPIAASNRAGMGR